MNENHNFAYELTKHIVGTNSSEDEKKFKLKVRGSKLVQRLIEESSVRGDERFQTAWCSAHRETKLNIWLECHNDKVMKDVTGIHQNVKTFRACLGLLSDNRGKALQSHWDAQVIFYQPERKDLILKDEFYKQRNYHKLFEKVKR